MHCLEIIVKKNAEAAGRAAAHAVNDRDAKRFNAIEAADIEHAAMLPEGLDVIARNAYEAGLKRSRQAG